LLPLPKRKIALRIRGQNCDRSYVACAKAFQKIPIFFGESEACFLFNLQKFILLKRFIANKKLRIQLLRILFTNLLNQIIKFGLGYTDYYLSETETAPSSDSRKSNRERFLRRRHSESRLYFLRTSRKRL